MITDQKLKEFISNKIQSDRPDLLNFWNIEAVFRGAKSQLDFTKDLANQKLRWFDQGGKLIIFDFGEL